MNTKTSIRPHEIEPHLTAEKQRDRNDARIEKLFRDISSDMGWDVEGASQSDEPVAEPHRAEARPTFEAVSPPPLVSVPIAETSPEKVSHDQLRLELEAIYKTTKAEDYSIVRERILTLELAINNHRSWSPYARPNFSIPAHPKARKDIHKLIQQDRVVIDCHWLHLTCKKQAVKEPKWQPLVDPRVPFPLELAKEFGRRAIKSAIRADEILCLSPFQQAQLRTIVGTIMREARKKADNAIPGGRSPLGKMLCSINQWASYDPRVNVERYAALARAMVMLEDRKHTNSELGAVVGLMLAEPPIKESLLRGMKRRLTDAMKNHP